MKVTFDTNVIIRLLVADDAQQLRIATDLLARAEQIFVPAAVLCECVWVMRRVYKIAPSDIADQLELLLADERVRVPVEISSIGLALLRSGGDFADAVIAIEGARSGGDTLVTFDRAAARLLTNHGVAVTLLG